MLVQAEIGENYSFEHQEFVTIGIDGAPEIMLLLGIC